MAFYNQQNTTNQPTNQPEALGNVKNPFIVITLNSLTAGLVEAVKVPSMGQIEAFNHLQFLKQFNCMQKNSQSNKQKKKQTTVKLNY